MTATTLATLVAAANAPLEGLDRTRRIGDPPYRYELYHFALSLCSQKVRATLAETGASYIAHDINIQPGNYHPDYVRLRMLGAPEGSEFATGYTGRSSVGTEGFDPAVVPTLVDHDAGLVVTDSARICAHIDRETGGRLIPKELVEEIAREIAIVDASPHVALLYGTHPDHDFRPERIRSAMSGVHDRKIAKLRAASEDACDDPDLAAAFEAKIEKESSGRAFVNDPDRMRAATEEMLGIVEALEGRLSGGRRHVCGEPFTLADIMWSIALFRLKWIGLGFAWTGGHPLNATARPAVADYAARIFARPSFRAAAVDWPGMPRSEFVADHYPDG